MLELAVLAIVMVAHEPIVMVAATLIRDGSEWVGVVTGQGLCKPRIVRDTTAEQHRGGGESLQRQREQ